MQEFVQVIEADKKGFDPALLNGVTCANLPSNKVWEILLKYIDFRAENIPTYCVTIDYSIYNFKYTDLKLYKQGFLNLERFPCRKTCGFCRGKFSCLIGKNVYT